MDGRVLQSGRSTRVRHGAALLLALYLAWLVSPALHQLHQLYWHLESRAVQCQPCPVEEPDWRILSHPPDQPCSDPDHHHHPTPVHDEDHCLTCRLGAAPVAVLPFVGAPIHRIEVTPSAVDRTVLAPITPALLTVSPRAPPPPPSA